MSLLWMDYETEFEDLAEASFQKEVEENPDYYASLSPRTSKIIYRDTRYNIDFLYTAYLLHDDKIMADYAVWLYELLVSVIREQTPEQTSQYVIEHFDVIRRCVLDTVSPEKQPELLRLIDLAKEDIRKAAPPKKDVADKTCRYEAEIEQYLDSLFKKNNRRAFYLVQNFVERGIPLSDVYVEILAESMRRIGELWHTAQITVDTEHYCTSVTQMAMAELYPVLFETKRKNKTLLCACPGTELHEMGARMVADIFENDGWDSVYLGAAVPEDAMMDAVEENKPDLIALSVTMPQHLIACQEMVEHLRKEYPEAKIAVGGKAFSSTHELWKQWPVDFYAVDARDLLHYADQNC